MSDPRAEQAKLEADSWASFEAALEAIPRESWEDAGVLPGWSVKEMLWHMAGWLQKCARRLEEMPREESPSGPVRRWTSATTSSPPRPAP